MSIDPPPSDPPRDTLGIVAARRSHRGLPALIALLSVAALAAGVLTRMITGLPARQPGRATAQLPEEVVVDGLAARAEAAAMEHVVLQLDVSNDCAWPDCTVPWGHVPAFTLLDDGRVVYVDPAPGDPYPPRWVVRAAAPSPDAMALLTDQVDQLLRGHAPQLTDGDPCPAANGCPGSVIIRVRRDGVLRTFAAEEGTGPDARSALGGAAELLDGWSAEADAALPRTMVVMPADATRQSHGDAPPRTWVGDGVEDMPAMVDRDILNLIALSAAETSGAPGVPLGAIDAVGDAQVVSLPAFAALDDATIYRDKGWDFKTGEIAMPTVDGSDQRLVLTTRLVFVPWIYSDVDVAAMLDVYREARRNVVAARAAADAAAIAAGTPWPYDIVVTAVSQPLSIVRAPTPTPFPTAPRVTWTDDRRPRLPTGRGIQTWMQWYRYDEDRAALTRLREASFEWFKQRFAWSDLQPTGSQDLVTTNSDLYIQSVHDLGGRVMIQLAVPPAWAVDRGAEDPFNLIAWGRFVQAFALRYTGRVDAYEIMNEPNLAREWGGPPDPAAYARVLKAAYEAIKAEDPSAVVISAGLAPSGDRMPEAMGDVSFLNQLYAAMGNASDGYFDALGAHAPGFKVPPGISPDEAAANANYGGDRTFTFRRVEDLRARMSAHGDDDKPVVITEFGWTVDPRQGSDYHWAAVTPGQRAMFIGEAFGWVPVEYNWTDWLGPMILFSAADRAWTPDDEAYWWAVADADGNVDGAVAEALGEGGGAGR